MLRIILYIIFSLAACVLFGQQDTRAELRLIGKIKQLNISPDESLWIGSSSGNLYHASSINDTWKTKPFKLTKSRFDIVRPPALACLGFFNAKTAIMAGQIQRKSQSLIYRTTNGGEHWDTLHIPKNRGIENIYTKETGEAWMIGDFKEVFYSSDYGKTWERVVLPFSLENNIKSLSMENESNGLLGTHENEILLTTDNWKSVQQLSTPLDQKRYTERPYADNSIHKIIFWNEYIIVKQDKYVFYSYRNKIKWRKLRRLSDFELDEKNNVLFGISTNLEVLTVKDIDEFTRIAGQQFDDYLLDITAMNGTLFVLDYQYQLHRITENTHQATPFYTREYPIEKPNIVEKASYKMWGTNRNDIYLSDDFGQSWYRIEHVDFDIASMKVIDDDHILIWDGNHYNYKYSIKTKTFSIHETKEPITDFLSAPIEYVTIDYLADNEFYPDENSITYTLNDEKTLIATSYLNNDSLMNFQHDIDQDGVYEVLSHINKYPNENPDSDIISISKNDIKRYLREFEKIYSEKENPLNISLQERESILQNLPKLQASYLSKMLYATSIYSPSQYYSLRVEFTNANNDVLTFSNFYYVLAKPYYLPWLIEYNGRHFSSCNIDFSMFMNSILPDNFLGKQSKKMNKRFLLDKIIEYEYYWKRE